ncbi:hypothetical protein LTR53_011014 [Teratosphaeriaceae sp. CCFEE 6253]|nr:hypothetical protein LTR53_011014 [Teratosphaeriaceae sp. CCFEE 6253]
MDHYPPADEPAVDPQIVGSPYPDPASQQMQTDVDSLLRKKRKAREHKACYPCRQRKVKCDLSRPCQTCRDRDHPELCSYHPPNKRQSLDPGSSTIKTEDEILTGPGFVTLGRGEFDLLCSKLNGLENSIAELRHELSRNSMGRPIRHESSTSVGAISLNGDSVSRRPTHTDVHGLHTKNDKGEIVHLGGGSIPAMLYSMGHGQGHSADEKMKLQEFLGKSILPLFGLDNESATYPFVDLWGLPHGSLQRAQELAKALPNDTQCLELFHWYRDLGWVIYPGIAELNVLEEDITEFLFNRAAIEGSMVGVSEQSIYGKTYQWLAVLFAVLGSGAQCSQMPRRQRELTSQVYICCSFECLRFTNFLSQPHIETIQALLVIGNVIANNMNAGTAWSFLGLTIRLAQGLGLHRHCPPNVPTSTTLPRAKIWWATIWQDSLLSMTYDRASTAGAEWKMPLPQHIAEVEPYHATMYRLSKVSLDIVRDRAATMEPSEQYHRILQHRDEISDVMKESAEYLRDSRKCTSHEMFLEHWGLYLHASYALSELFRPAISPSASGSELSELRQPCIDNLINVIESYLGLNNITTFARQSWAATHRALSSALLLGILGEHTRSERARRLISRFIAVIGDIAGSVDPEEISAPVQRGLAALGRLGIRDSASAYGGNGAFTHHDGVSPGLLDGLPKLDHSALFTPARSEHSSLPGEEYSPYSILNNILWGEADLRQPETLVM